MQAASERGQAASQNDRQPSQWLLVKVQQYLRLRGRTLPSSGDLEAAWEDFFAGFQPFVENLLRSCGVPVSVREDCAQDVWLEVVARLPDFHDGPHPWAVHAWLTKLTRAKATDWYRRQRQMQRLRDAVSGTPDPERHGGDPVAQAVRRERARLIHQGLSDLRCAVSASTFRVIRLRCLEGLSVRETCSQLGKNPQQVWDRQRRGLKKLQAICRQLATDW